MLCMYMGGAMTKLDVPGGGNRVVKYFYWIDGAHVSYFILHGVIP